MVLHHILAVSKVKISFSVFNTWNLSFRMFCTSLFFDKITSNLHPVLLHPNLFDPPSPYSQIKIPCALVMYFLFMLLCKFIEISEIPIPCKLHVDISRQTKITFWCFLKHEQVNIEYWQSLFIIMYNLIKMLRVKTFKCVNWNIKSYERYKAKSN